MRVRVRALSHGRRRTPTIPRQVKTRGFMRCVSMRAMSISIAIPLKIDSCTVVSYIVLDKNTQSQGSQVGGPAAVARRKRAPCMEFSLSWFALFLYVCYNRI